MIQIKDYLIDIYRLCGNLTRDQLPYEVVLTYLNSELNKRVKQMGMSEQNYFLKSVELAITNDLDQPLAVEDFGTPVAVHFLNPNLNATISREIPVEMVNFNALYNVAIDGRLVCSIYGDDTETFKRIRFSIPLNQYSGWRLKIWYEPRNEAAKGPNANSPVTDQFRPLVTYTVAKNVLPFAEIPEDMRRNILDNLSVEILQWEDLWDRDINRSKLYGNNRRTPYRAGRFDRRNFRY